MAADSMLMPGASPAGTVVRVQRWGKLRFLRRRSAQQVVDGGRAEPAPAESFPSDRAWHELEQLPVAEAAFDPRAAAVALRQVLAEWRATERGLAAHAEGSLDWFHDQAEITVLRAAYRRLFDEIRRRSPERQPDSGPSFL